LKKIISLIEGKIAKELLLIVVVSLVSGSILAQAIIAYWPSFLETGLRLSLPFAMIIIILLCFGFIGKLTGGMKK